MLSWQAKKNQIANQDAIDKSCQRIRRRHRPRHRTRTDGVLTAIRQPNLVKNGNRAAKIYKTDDQPKQTRNVNQPSLVLSANEPFLYATVSNDVLAAPRLPPSGGVHLPIRLPTAAQV